MNISGASPTTLLDSVLTAQNTQTEIGVAVLKKAQDSEKQERAALVNMLDELGPQTSEQGLNALA